MNQISKLVKSQRLSLGLTMEQVAKEASLSQGFLSRLEGGDYDAKNMSIDTIIKLAGALRLRVKDFFDSIQKNTEGNYAPELSIYLREKYDMTEPHDIQIIESMIRRLRNNGK